MRLIARFHGESVLGTDTIPSRPDVPCSLSVAHTTAPGGLHCIYLVKILGSMVLGDNLVAAEKNFIAEKGFAPPRIHDGAWLGWFDMLATGTTARTVAWFGNFTFVWG